MFYISLPLDVFDPIMIFLLDTFVENIHPEAVDFLKNKFRPEIIPLLEDVQLTIE